jgi:hypothetical protein
MGNAGVDTYTIYSELPGGAYASMTLTQRKGSLRLPALRFWEPRIRVMSESSAAVVTYDPLPLQGYGAEPEFRIIFRTRTDNAWSRSLGQVPARFDQRLLEDFVGTVQVKASTTGVIGASEFRFEYLSAPVAFRGKAGAPLSRAASCLQLNALHREVIQQPCSLTDGKLDRRYTYPPRFLCADNAVDGQFPGCLHRRPDSVVIDLGTNRRVVALAIRGCFIVCKVATSIDGKIWSDPLELSFPEDYANGVAVGLSDGYSNNEARWAPRQVRYIRMTEHVDDLVEVSAW